jgi:hypothetical protein
MMPTSFLTLVRDWLIWWTQAAVVPIEIVHNALDDEIERRAAR